MVLGETTTIDMESWQPPKPELPDILLPRLTEMQQSAQGRCPTALSVGGHVCGLEERESIAVDCECGSRFDTASCGGCGEVYCAFHLAARFVIGSYDRHTCDYHIARGLKDMSDDTGDWQWFYCLLCGDAMSLSLSFEASEHPPGGCGRLCDVAPYTVPDCIGCGMALAEDADGFGMSGEPCAVCVTAVTGVHPSDSTQRDFALCRICGMRLPDWDYVSRWGECVECWDSLMRVGVMTGATWNQARGMLVKRVLESDAVAVWPEKREAKATRRRGAIEDYLAIARMIEIADVK